MTEISDKAQQTPTNTTEVDPPLYGRTKRHPWLWGVAHTRDFDGEPRTWLRSEHTTREAAEAQFAAQVKFATIERVSNPSRDHRLLEPTEPMPTFPTVEAAIEASPLKPVTLYEWECPICAVTLNDYHGDYSCMEASEAIDAYQEHLRGEHRLAWTEDLATCRFCGDEFDASETAPCRESSEGCEADDA